MSKEPKLYMILLGCKPKGRNTEQHDIYFGIGNSLNDLVPSMNEFWPEAKTKLHIDAWREVTQIGDFKVEVRPREGNLNPSKEQQEKLYFINLGGYKRGEFEEFHYKILTVSESIDAAKKNAKGHAFYKHTGFRGATAHLDDKYGLDIDEMYTVEDALSKSYKDDFKIIITLNKGYEEDIMHLGYLPLTSIKLL